DLGMTLESNASSAASPIPNPAPYPATAEAAPEAGPAAVPAIELVNAARWYGNGVAVNDVSFTLGPGVTGLLGPNGAGKTTILNMIVGLLRPSGGTVTVSGTPSWQHPGIYRTLGFVPESEGVYAFLSGYEFVLLNARLQGVTDAAAATARAIALVELEPAQHRPIATYSK